MSFDTNLALFSPDGRLIQVERAHHASEQGALVAFTKNNERISICIERRLSSKMLVEDPSSKLVLIDPITNIYASFSGLSPDANYIKRQAILIARQYKYDTTEDITIVQLATLLAEVKQKNTIAGGVRPYGIRTVLFGYYEGFRMFVIEPDGNYAEYTKGAIGSKCKTVLEYLENSSGEHEAVEAVCQVINCEVGNLSVFHIDKSSIERMNEDYVSGFVKRYCELNKKP